MEAVHRLVNHVVQGGVDGVMPTGTTGEALALSPTTRRRLVEAVVEAAAGRVPVVVGIGSTSLEQVLDLCEHAGEAGAQAVALHPPPYFPLDDASLSQFYQAVIDRSPVPVELYTIPSFTGNGLSLELVDELMGREKVIALKDSTGDPHYRVQAIEVARKHGKGVLAGDEMAIVEAASEGAIGIVPSTANLLPGQFAHLWKLCIEESWAEARALQKVLNEPIADAIAQGGWLGMMRKLKSALFDKAICSPCMASVFAASPKEELI